MELLVWTSANGLDWTEAAGVPWHPILEGVVYECWRVGVTFHAAGPQLVASATAGPACCDNPPTHGMRRISSDGNAWEALVLPEVEDGSAETLVTGAIAADDVLILVGHTGKRAAFWFNEAP